MGEIVMKLSFQVLRNQALPQIVVKSLGCDLFIPITRFVSTFVPSWQYSKDLQNLHSTMFPQFYK